MQTRKQWAGNETRLAFQRLSTGLTTDLALHRKLACQSASTPQRRPFQILCTLQSAVAGRSQTPTAKPSARSFASSRELLGFWQTRDARAHDRDCRRQVQWVCRLMITFRNATSFSVYVIGQARTRRAAPALQLLSQFSIPKGPALNISNDISHHHLRVSRSLLNSNAAQSYWRCASAVQRETAFYCNMPAARVSAAFHSCHSW